MVLRHCAYLAGGGLVWDFPRTKILRKRSFKIISINTQSPCTAAYAPSAFASLRPPPSFSFSFPCTPPRRRLRRRIRGHPSSDVPSRSLWAIPMPRRLESRVRSRPSQATFAHRRRFRSQRRRCHRATFESDLSSGAALRRNSRGPLLRWKNVLACGNSGTFS